LNSNLRQFRFIFLLSLSHLKNRICFSRGVQVAGMTWCAAMSIVARVGDLVQRTGDSRTDRVAPCAVYTVHVETMRAGFLVEL
jgi:hypothetical protein